jgi:hypothetical protein
MAPMHTPQGIGGHFRDNVRKELRSFDETEGSWLQEVARVLEEAEAVMGMDWKEAEKKQSNLHSNISRKENEIRRKRKDGAVQAVIDWAEAQVQKLRQDLELHLIESGLGRRSQLCRGADTIVKGIKEYLDPKNKRPRGKAEYVYNQAIPIFANVKYRKEYGGTSLSHRDNMQVLAAWDKVCKAVLVAFDGHPDQQALVQIIMDKSKKLAAPLFTLSKLLKSQQKCDDAWVEAIKDAIAEVYYCWVIDYPQQDCFPKLHHLVWHIIFFIVEHGFYGIGSEEGFEAIHPQLNKIIKDLKPMMNTEQRLQTTLDRLMSSMDSRVESITQEFNTQKASMAKNRPTEYKTQGRSRNKESGLIIDTGLQADANDNFLYMPECKGLIKACWREVAKFVCHSKAPSSWSKVFADSEDLGNAKKEEATFVWRSC